MPQLRGIIFDLDGTLVDSKLDFDRMRSDIGVPADIGILEHIDGLTSDDDRASAIQILRHHEMAGAQAAQLITGVPDLLQKIGDHRLRRAIFTRNEREPTEFVVDRFFRGVFDSVITRADAKPKPHPEGLLRICETWHCTPDDVIFVGDYDYDLEAGLRAGIKTVLYLNEDGWPSYASKASYVTRCMRDFETRFESVIETELGFRL